jgi:CRISPR-associated protein Csy1
MKYETIENLTVIKFGGSNPRNISVLNTRNGGKFYLLPSLPPQISSINLPCFDFFKTLNRQMEFKRAFVELRTLVVERDDFHKLINQIIDLAIMHIFTVREKNLAGWSKDNLYSNLSDTQKILLDDEYKERRKDDAWLDSITKSFNRWIINTLKKQTRGIQLDTRYLKFVKRVIKNTVALNLENFSW